MGVFTGGKLGTAVLTLKPFAKVLHTDTETSSTGGAFLGEVDVHSGCYG